MRIDRIVDAATLLARALLQSARAAGCEARIVAAADEPWSSTTFAGTRHRIVLAATDGPAAAAWLGALPEAELPLRGHIVVDLAVEMPATLHVVTIEEG